MNANRGTNDPTSEFFTQPESLHQIKSVLSASQWSWAHSAKNSLVAPSPNQKSQIKIQKLPRPS